MMPMRHIFIANPAAGKKDQTLTAAGHIGRLCRELGLEYEIFVTEYPRHACEIVDRERAEHPDKLLRFYACGGDGTLNEVAGAAVQHDNTQVTHYPMGSGNDFIRMFRDLERFHDLKELLEGDVLELDYLQTDCGVSVNIFSVGADARISAGMQKYKRLPGLGGSAAYIASIGEHFIRGLCRPCRVEVDGRVFDGKQTLVLAANGRFYGGGFYPTPDADPTDGWMDVVIVHGVSRLTAAKVIGMYQKGHAKDLPEYITVLRAKEMTITSTDGKTFVLNLDGENRPADSLRVWVPQRKMHFVVPRGVEILPPGTGVTPLKK